MSSSDLPLQDLSEPQLFLDDTWITDSAFVQRVWHQARKFPHPVLTAEHEWEQWCAALFGSVMHREGTYHMWYSAWTRRTRPRLCYAHSNDGVSWEKPELGLCDFNGNTHNNIVLQPEMELPHPEGALIDDATVIEDPEDRQWPLKMLFWEGAYGEGLLPGSGIHAARSRDGLHWERLGLGLPQWGDRFNALPQKLDGKFIVFGRAPGTATTGAGTGVNKGRSVWRSESADLSQWSEPEMVLACDIEDPPLMQTYSLPAWKYAGLLIGGMERMHMAPDVLDTEIVWSRDGGKTWQRSRPRPSFIAAGELGQFDATWLNLSASTPLVNEGQFWFYYSGRSGAHGVRYPHNHGAIGLATLRIDGFASLQAKESWGMVLTTPLLWPGGELHVNCDPRRNLDSHPGFCGGELRVEVRDQNNRPLDGYSWEDCLPITRNTATAENASIPVTWRNGKLLHAFASRSVCLAFKFRDCHLYSFHAVMNQ